MYNLKDSVLRKSFACKQARDYCAKYNTVTECWNNCINYSWMISLSLRIGIDHDLLAQAIAAMIDKSSLFNRHSYNKYKEGALSIYDMYELLLSVQSDKRILLFVVKLLATILSWYWFCTVFQSGICLLLSALFVWLLSMTSLWKDLHTKRMYESDELARILRRHISGKIIKQACKNYVDDLPK